MKKKIVYVLIAFMLFLSFSACAKESSEDTAINMEEERTEARSDEFSKDALPSYDVTVEYKKSDEYFDYTKENPIYITCKDNYADCKDASVNVQDGRLIIDKEGIYVFSGNLYGTIEINVGEENAKVYLVLDNVSIEALDGPAIYEKACDKLVIMLPSDSVSNIKDAALYSDTSENAPTGALFARDNLTINGTGTLNVSGLNNDAIVTKDDLKIMGGNINITSVDDGLVGRDFIAVKDGCITIDAKDDGIKTTNDDLDNDKGNIILENGILDITAGGDGILATNRFETDNAQISISAKNNGIKSVAKLTINSGIINVTESYEGLDAEDVLINGGNISICSTDDGINVSGKNRDAELCVNGGNITVDASGDGIDSNGNLEINGGFLYVSGSTANFDNATDYQGTFLMNGGCIIATGSSGMYQSISEGSKCFALDYTGNSFIPADTECNLYDGDTLLYSFNLIKKASAVLISSDELKEGKEYTLKYDDVVETLTAGEGKSGGMFGPGEFGSFEGPKGPRPDGLEMEPWDGTEFPEGMKPWDGTDFSNPPTEKPNN